MSVRVVNRVERRVPGGVRALLIGVASVALLTRAGPVEAQAIERHLPALQEGEGHSTMLESLPSLQAQGSDQPIGAIVRRIVVRSSDGLSNQESSEPVVTDDLPPGVAGPMARALAPYLGRALSFKLISEISNIIVQEMRRKGFPFVSVSVPPQEIGNGELIVVLNSFRLGKLTVSGADFKLQNHVRRAIRQRVDSAIDARALSSDLDSLNEFPFRSVAASFSRGTQAGATDLDLSVKAVRPYRIEAGVHDVGSLSGDGNRYYLGLTAGGWPLLDFQAGVRITTSSDAWAKRGALRTGGGPRYLSASGLMAVPLAPRRQLHLTLNWLASNVGADPFVFQTEMQEVTIMYQGNLWGSFPASSQMSLGLELRRQVQRGFFGDAEVINQSADVAQVALGWSKTVRRARQVASLDLTVHASPGRMTSKNNPTALSAVGGSVPVAARYAFINGNIRYAAMLPIGIQLQAQLSAQLATDRLPASERTGIAGLSGGAAYGQDSGAFDDGAVLTTTLRAPAMGLAPRLAAERNWVQPYWYAEIGYAGARREGGGRLVAATGAGISASAFGKIFGAVSLARILARVGDYHARTWRFNAQALVRF